MKRIIIKGIRAEIIDASTNQESCFFISKWIVDYAIESLYLPEAWDMTTTPAKLAITNKIYGELVWKEAPVIKDIIAFLEKEFV